MSNLPPLWPHQEAAIQSVLLALAAGRKSGLVVLPTGCGKTGMVLSLGARLQVPMLFLVHRDELLAQTCLAAARFWPSAYAVAIRSGVRHWDGSALNGHRLPDLAVAMVPTLVRRLDTIASTRFAMVVADEAHLSLARTWQRVISHFREAFLLGVTATPERLDSKPLSTLYGEQPLYSYSLHQAIQDGRLCPLRVESVVTEVDLDAIETVGGDFAKEQLAVAVNTPGRNAQVVEAYQMHGTGRRAIAFCVDVDHCEDLAESFRAAGVRAAAVHGQLDRDVVRPGILQDFARGQYQVLTSCEVLTTGFDDPGVACVLWARPTQSKTLYIQGTGRGLRLAPSKADCLVIDFTDNCHKHKLVCALDLTGRKKPLGVNASGEAETHEREDSPAELVDVPIVAWQLKQVCPWPAVPSVDGYVPMYDWHNDPATSGQLRALASYGLSPNECLSKGEASYLLDRCAEYDAAFPLPATPKQRYCLESAGLWEEGISRRQASVLITHIKQRDAIWAG